MRRYLRETMTSDVFAAQDRYYGRRVQIDPEAERDLLTDAELEFIARRDHFYLATIGGDGWPYVQHRGGPAGFLRVLDRATLAFADFKGNRQLISTGNLSKNDRASLLLIDSARRERLKILGHMRVFDAREHAALADRIAPPELRRKTERILVLDVVGYDWNCPAYITPRFTEDEIRASTPDR